MMKVKHIAKPLPPPEMPAHGHEPVLPNEVLQYLDPQPGDVAVDCTVGRGGHASLLAERLAPDGRLIGLDRDPDNLAYARDRLRDAPCSVELYHANFAETGGLDVPPVDVLLADFGVSTNQLLGDTAGLSFDGADAPLDMRLDPDLRQSAADILQHWPEKRIADTIYAYGDERFSRRIARRIVERRKTEPFRRAGDLASLVRRCVPRSRNGPDPATRTFQALRIAVNGELDAITKLLADLPDRLTPGGRCVVISFHSGEDRLAKRAIQQHHSDGRLERLTKKPVTPSEQEILANPRARSAKLRAVRRPISG
jgi:16S rRNA (cytosine1402-N4)-methyltransferase